jgi:hypothetical protein
MFRQLFDGSSALFANGVGGAVHLLRDLHERQFLHRMHAKHLAIMFGQLLHGFFQLLILFPHLGLPTGGLRCGLLPKIGSS